MFGLSTQDVSVGYSTINYAWFTRNDIGQLEIYENGTFRGDFGVYGVGDILRVSVDANGVIHYYHNGIQVPISSGAATFPLSVDTSFYTPGAQIQNTVLYADNLGPVPLPTLTPQSVNWVDQRNVNVKGTSLTKSSQAGTDWNAGAVSASNQFILSGAGYVEFSAPTTSDSFMVGLSSRDTDVGFATINYAWFVRADTGILEIYENGTWKGYYGVYGTFSVLRVQVDPSGTVSYYHNGRLMHTTSGITLSYPLMVDVSMWTPSGQIVNTTIGGVSIGSVPSPYPPGQPIGWVDQRNVTVNLITNSIVKNINSTNWDAGAASSQAILPGAGYMEATVADISTSVMFGLSTQDLSTGFSTINYAWFTRSDTGQLEIYENGTFRGDFGLYDPGDVLRIALKSNGKVTYYHNGVSIFASSTIATFPLSVDTSIYSTNGQIKNVMLYAANLGPVPLPTLTPQSVNWVDRRNVSVANNTLTKDTSAGADWNAGAVSASNQFILSGVGYVEFTAPAITHSFMVGLSSRDTDVGFASINYAWFVRADTGTLEVYENGVFKGSYGVYGAGSVLRVQADPSGVVSYYHNGRLLRTSTGANLTYPLMVDVSMWTPGGQILNTTLGGENLGPVPSPYPPGQPVSWVDQRNVTVTPTVNSILKNAGGSSWNAGAASTQDILSGIGYVDMTLGPLQHEALFGLSTQDVDLCWCTVSYGWHTRTDNGQLEIYENGAWQGSFGLYDPGDVLRVAVDANGTVTYYHNGVLARTSNRVATFPLLVDTAIKDQGTQLLNVMLYAASGGPPPAPSPSPVAVWWIDPANVAAVSNTLTKTSAGFWDGGAASNTSIKSGAGYIQATIASTADEIMLGMSSEDRDICWCTIQYGWHTRPDLGLLEIYENGIRLPGFYGEYGAGSVLRVQVDANGIVSYYHNNWLVYISAVSATYPLLLDTSLNTFNATLQDAVMSGANLVLNTKQFGSLASGDYVAWSTLSIPLVDGQLPQQNVNVVNPATHRLMSITGSPGYQTAPAVSGNMMVWEDNSHSCATCERDVLGEDLSTGYTFPVATGPVDQVSPAINGSLVVWVEATDNGSSIWQKEIPSGQPELVASIAADQIVSVPVVSSSYIVWSEKPSNGAIGNTIVIHSYDRATGVVNTAVRSDEMNTEFAIFDYRLVLANNQGISVTDLNTDQTSVVSSIGGFSPTIQGTQVMWVSGSSPNPDVNNFDIWYLDLANPANGPIALVTDPQSQFNPAVSGTRFAYTDSFPFVLGGDQRIYATERFGNIVVGDLPTALQAVRQNASQKLSVMPTPRPTVIAPSGKAASTGSDAPATTARISKGVDAANGDGWGFNPAAAVDVLGPSPDEGYFGAVLVLSSDLPAVVMPTNPAWREVSGPTTVGSIMKKLFDHNTRIMVRLMDRAYPTHDGSVAPESVANDIDNLLTQYPWIQDIQVHNEPNIEWPSTCESEGPGHEGCYWTNSHLYVWHDVTDPKFYDAINDFYSEVWQLAHARHPQVNFWTPPMAPTYRQLADKSVEYDHLTGMINIFACGIFKCFAYHNYTFPAAPNTHNYGYGIRNNSFDWFPSDLQCEIDFFDAGCSVLHLQQIRAQITEYGWTPDRMPVPVWATPVVTPGSTPAPPRWIGGCGHNQVSNFWPSIQPTATAAPGATVIPVRQTGCDGYAFDATDPNPPNADHTFSGDIEHFITWYMYGAETVYTWTIGGGGSSDPNNADGLTRTGTVTPWLQAYQQWQAP